MIKGISVCNPVDIDKDYLLETIDFAGEKGFDHVQVIGPIHDGTKGNIDGMTLYRKYGSFDHSKNMVYVQHCLEAVNAACSRAKEYGIKIYQWHHELELPVDFKEVYPQVLNSCGDIEVSHPLVKDFLEHKLRDFFYCYPGMDGIILTLHETKIPLLKLKNQKLDKISRVKYVTEILHRTCAELGKELIVRPFASIEEDYMMMTKAYEEISAELMIMDKWTQFDWSLTMPHNAFFRMIKKNPLFVEADIFGEFFGKGYLPLMLNGHIADKFAYCEKFTPKGYVARIDRGGQHPFGDVNEVNLHIMCAWLNGEDPDEQINQFFQKKYPNAASEVRDIMERTEEVLSHIIYAQGYYYSELSFFPRLNHCKNHFYFEMMRKEGNIASEEWFIPRGWKNVHPAVLLEEKSRAAKEAAELLRMVEELQNCIEEEEYRRLWCKFCNLRLAAEGWLLFAKVFADYATCLEEGNRSADERDVCKAAFMEDFEKLLQLNSLGVELLGEKFYGNNLRSRASSETLIEQFVREVRESYFIEKKTLEDLREEGLTDYIVCGGALEGHQLKKEVNFSDTLVKDGALCRIPGSIRGIEWCSVNAHGWFSYLIKVRPNADNTIKLVMESSGTELDAGITIGTEEYEFHEKSACRKEYTLHYREEAGEKHVRIRIDKISGYTPYIYLIKVL